MTEENQSKRKREKKPTQQVAVVEIIPPDFPAKRKRGRPSEYSNEIADRVCELLARGISLNEICESGKYPEMPGLNAVYNWLRAFPSFAQNYVRAKEDSADTLAAKILDVVEHSEPETVNVDRLKVDAYKWIASKLKPKSYGDRVQAQLTGADGGAIKVQAVPVDANEIGPEVREALRAALIAATTNKEDNDE